MLRPMTQEEIAALTPAERMQAAHQALRGLQVASKATPLTAEDLEPVIAILTTN